MIETESLKEVLLNETSLSEKLIDILMEKLPEVMLDCAKELDAIAIPGFGTFFSEKQDERVVTDKTNGENVMLPPQIKYGFKSSVVLRKKFVG